MSSANDVDRPINPPKRRRLLQFSLRTLLLFVLLCACSCSWLAVKMQQLRKQREAIEALRHFPGGIQYDYQRAKEKVPPGPEWLRRWAGDDVLAHVEFVCLGGNEKFTDETMVHVEALPRLKVLRIGGAAVSDAGLEHLGKLTQLEQLNLSRTGITDAGLEQLAILTHLNDLMLYETRVTAAGVAKLQTVLPGCRIHWVRKKRTESSVSRK
jgi:hypothetical protein